MSKVVLLVEDTKGGKYFYTFLKENGLFKKNVEIVDTEEGTGWVGGGYDFRPSLNHLISTGKLESGDTLVLAIDNQIPINAEMNHDKGIHRNRVDASIKILKTLGIKCHVTTFLSWEGLILSYKDLINVCKFEHGYNESLEETFNTLHEMIYSKNEADISPSAAQIYMRQTKKYRNNERTTVEAAISYMTEQITGRPELRNCRHFRIKKSEIGSCWRINCDNNKLRDESKTYCGRCYMANKLHLSLSSKRLEHLIQNSQIKLHLDLYLEPFTKMNFFT